MRNLKKAALIETEIRMVVAMTWGWGKWGDIGQKAQISSIRQISSGDPTYSMVTIINNNILHTCKLLREEILNVLNHTHTHTHKCQQCKNKTIYTYI